MPTLPLTEPAMQSSAVSFVALEAVAPTSSLVAGADEQPAAATMASALNDANKRFTLRFMSFAPFYPGATQWAALAQLTEASMANKRHASYETGTSDGPVPPSRVVSPTLVDPLKSTPSSALTYDADRVWPQTGRATDEPQVVVASGPRGSFPPKRSCLPSSPGPGLRTTSSERLLYSTMVSRLRKRVEFTFTVAGT
jgi:hypothetical protein